MVKQWLRRHNLPTTMLQLLPTHGVIVPDIAVAFLYRTDSKIAYIDGFMSNPDASLHARARAFQAIAVALEELARQHGFSHLWGFTDRGEVAELAHRHGWQIDEGHYRFIGRDLT